MKSSKTSPDLLSRAGLVLLLGIACALSACGGGSSEGGANQPSGTPGSRAPNTATLAWDPVAHSGLGGYRVYYGTTPGVYLQPMGSGIDVGNVTTFTITGLSSGTRYYFAATAFDTANNESGFSNEVFKDIP